MNEDGTIVVLLIITYVTNMNEDGTIVVLIIITYVY